jgi:probable HAF family extracellular repeat protein
MRRYRLRAQAGGALLVVLAFGCGEGPGTQPDDADPAFAKASGGVSVTAADPAYGKQGTVGLEVRVLGSGFDQGSRASWERGGAPDPKITVNSTAFVGSSELRANIDIEADADIDLYDVAVYTARGRKGIGTEKFEVTAALSLGFGGLGRGINDNGQVVGYSTEAFVWTPGTGFQGLGPGVAFEIDQAGTTIVGTTTNDANGALRIWTGSVTGGWTGGTLPGTGGGGAGLAIASGSNGTAIYIAGNANTPVTKRERIPIKKPARWTGSGTSWTLELLPLPPGLTSGRAEDINASGIAVGLNGELFDDVHQPLVWEAGGVTVLPPLASGALGHARAINAAGTLVVGGSDGEAVFWTRPATGMPWEAPVALDDPPPTARCGAQGTSIAYDVNESGVIVGQSCDEAVAWKVVGGTVVDRLELGGLGPGQGLSWSEAVNAAGRAAGRAGSTAVTWQVP